MGKCKELMLEKLYQGYTFGDYDNYRFNFKMKRDNLMIKLIEIHDLVQGAITDCETNERNSCKEKLTSVIDKCNSAIRTIR